MSLALLFHYLLLNMFRMLIHSSSGACDLFDALLHGLYCSGSMCVGVTVWFGWGGVVSGCKLKHFSNQNNTTHEITHQISRKLLRMDVLTSETCWAVNKEIIKQVTSSWSLLFKLVVVPEFRHADGQTWRNINVFATFVARTRRKEIQGTFCHIGGEEL